MIMVNEAMSPILVLVALPASLVAVPSTFGTEQWPVVGNRSRAASWGVGGCDVGDPAALRGAKGQGSTGDRVAVAGSSASGATSSGRVSSS
jgi:hypothetical protein